MKKEPGKAYGAAGLDHELCLQGQPANCGPDFVFRDRDDLVDVLRNVLKVDLANRLRAQSVRQSTAYLFGGQ